MPAFTPGDRVAWDHAVATQHAEGSILRADSLPGGKFGEVRSVSGGLAIVKFEDEERELTCEELVRVA